MIVFIDESGLSQRPHLDPDRLFNRRHYRVESPPGRDNGQALNPGKIRIAGYKHSV